MENKVLKSKKAAMGKLTKIFVGVILFGLAYVLPADSAGGSLVYVAYSCAFPVVVV